jgi:hypothetical protein
MLPRPMLARPDALLRGDYSYEVTWDAFRAIWRPRTGSRSAAAATGT